MVWFFRRGELTTRIETRFDKASGEFVLTIIGSDGPPQVERYADEKVFEDRLRTLERRLESDDWRQEGPPIVLPLPSAPDPTVH